MAKINVYSKNETSFVHNGIVLPDIISCPVEEELNGKYILELTHPIDENGKWEYLIEENIIKADGQLFRIHSTEKNLSYVYVYARHIFYDLLHNFLEDVRPTNLNGAGALNWILSNTQYPHNFIGVSDIDTLNTQYYIRKNPVEAILSSDSLVTRWNGELVRDNYTIKLLRQRGQNKGAKIAYGKNMLGLEVKKDMDTVITRIMPQGRDGILLPEKYVDSPLINNYAFPRIQKIEFDIGIDEETSPEQAYEKMRQACNDLYSINKVDIPYININTNLLMLENTEEYKHIKNLVKVELGDTVSCTDNPLNITFEAKVIRIKKDTLSNRNVEVELGQFKQGISNTISNAIKDISQELQNSTSDLQKAIDNATELLTNALGGYVVKRPGELLIMDTEDITTATQVWRWNLNGLGYSNNSIEGPYELAMTMDGKINANFITTGILDAGVIKTGTIDAELVSFAGGAVTIDKDKVRINHGSISEYSEMRADGFVRKWGHGEATYLNDIYITNVYIDVAGSSPPSAFRVLLPESFRGRSGKVKEFVAISRIMLTTTTAVNDGHPTEFTMSYNTTIEIIGRNFNAEIPYIDVRAYAEYSEFKIGGNIAYRYQSIPFILMIIGT